MVAFKTGEVLLSRALDNKNSTH